MALKKNVPERFTRRELRKYIESVEDQYAVVLKYWLTFSYVEDTLAIYVHSIPAGEVLDYLPSSLQPPATFCYEREELAIEEAMYYSAKYWEAILQKHWKFYLAARPERPE